MGRWGGGKYYCKSYIGTSSPSQEFIISSNIRFSPLWLFTVYQTTPPEYTDLSTSNNLSGQRQRQASPIEHKHRPVSYAKTNDANKPASSPTANHPVTPKEASPRPRGAGAKDIQELFPVPCTTSYPTYPLYYAPPTNEVSSMPYFNDFPPPYSNSPHHLITTTPGALTAGGAPWGTVAYHHPHYQPSASLENEMIFPGKVLSNSAYILTPKIEFVVLFSPAFPSLAGDFQFLNYLSCFVSVTVIFRNKPT